MFTNEEFKNAIKEVIGDRNDDTVLNILEYLKETEQPTDHTEELKTLNERITALESEKAEIENTWRNKYKEAFFSTPKNTDMQHAQDTQFGKEPEQSKLDFENLFTELTN